MFEKDVHGEGDRGMLAVLHGQNLQNLVNGALELLELGCLGLHLRHLDIGIGENLKEVDLGRDGLAYQPFQLADGLLGCDDLEQVQLLVHHLVLEEDLVEALPGYLDQVVYFEVDRVGQLLLLEQHQLVVAFEGFARDFDIHVDV